MRFNPLVLLSLITATGAFLIPEGMEDGVYEHYVDENGQDVHIKIENATDVATTPVEPYTKAPTVSGPSRIMKRAATCAAGGELNHHDTDWTNSKIDEQCNNTPSVRQGGNKWAKSGDVIAFVCNFQLPGWGCDAGERQRTSGQITADCGWYKPGWVNIGGAVSYGYYRGNSICGYTVG